MGKLDLLLLKSLNESIAMEENVASDFIFQLGLLIVTVIGR